MYKKKMLIYQHFYITFNDKSEAAGNMFTESLFVIAHVCISKRSLCQSNLLTHFNDAFGH